MNEPTTEPTTGQRNDILISRAIDGDATAVEWDELTALAGRNPAVWRTLAMSLREHHALTRAVNAGVAVADVIEMPAAAAPGLAASTIEPRSARQSAVLARIGGWSGWAVAAIFTIAWVAGILSLVQNQSVAPNTAGPVLSTAQLGGSNASELLDAYLDRGRQEQSVIAELPERVLLETRPLESGKGYELLYLRQILERTVVPDLYEFHSQDEMGRPTLVRYDGDRGPSM